MIALLYYIAIPRVKHKGRRSLIELGLIGTGDVGVLEVVARLVLLDLYLLFFFLIDLVCIGSALGLGDAGSLGLYQFVHLLSPLLGLWTGDAVQSILQIFDISLLISDQTSIGGIPHTDIEVHMVILIEIAIGQFSYGDELIVSPALPNIKFGGILSNGRLPVVDVVDKLYLVLVLVLILFTFGELEKDR
jgi:hypothetical protein